MMQRFLLHIQTPRGGKRLSSVNGPLGTYAQASIGLNAECIEADHQLVDLVIESTPAAKRSCLLAGV